MERQALDSRTLLNTKDFVPESFSGPIWIAGPCSAESEEQITTIGNALRGAGISYFRCGVWKPRTRPNSFEGLGEKALPWLQTLQKDAGLKVIVEVANARHVEAILNAELSAVWIGARTTVNPFAVQEIADALRGTNIPVLVKNPINPDINLWIGALERLYQVGLTRLSACHRGFSTYVQARFRNLPYWEIPLELKRLNPQLPVITDVSHITGDASLIPPIAQKALDIGFDGLMVEVHPDPKNALSDAQQQLTPVEFLELMFNLRISRKDIPDSALQATLHLLREEIDLADRQLIEILQYRLSIASKIGQLKQQSGITFFQQDRYGEVLDKTSQYARLLKLNPEFIQALFEQIHVESIEKQGEW
jgi:chorismate mutase